MGRTYLRRGSYAAARFADQPQSVSMLALATVLAAAVASGAVAQSSQHPRVTITPRVIQLPVIPQGNYLDPGPGPAIRPDVKIGDDRNNDYVFPPDLSGGYGSGPPGDPTNNGQWSPLDGDTPSF